MSSRRWTQRFTVLAEGPFTCGPNGFLTTTLSVPLERLDPGPVGARVGVVVDPFPGSRSTNPSTEPGDATGEGDRLPADLNALASDREFVARQTYAIAAATLQLFEVMLGRRVPWRGDRQRLELHPFARIGPTESGYDRSCVAVKFGRLPRDGARAGVPLALFYDVVAHEVTHAIVDGYRPAFSEPDNSGDQRALHEAWADLVAMLSVFASPDRVRQALEAPGEQMPTAGPQRDAWLERSVLFGFADGLTTRNGRELRRAVVARPGSWREVDEPHGRGEAIVWGVMRTVLRVWLRRLAACGETSNLSQIADEGAKAGRHVLGMVVRGVGYTPPIDATFEDMIRGVLAADAAMVPEDSLGYRRMLRRSFAEIGLRPAPAPQLGRLAELRYPLHSLGLHADAEAVHRFLWDHPDLLRLAGVDPSRQLGTCRIRPTQRVGPDGWVVSEVALSFLQRAQLNAGEARRLTGRATGQIDLAGGGLLRFDESGRLNFASLKPVLDPSRQPWRWKRASTGAMATDAPPRNFFQDLHQPAQPAPPTQAPTSRR